jgi:hypothetical protein
MKYIFSDSIAKFRRETFVTEKNQNFSWSQAVLSLPVFTVGELLSIASQILNIIVTGRVKEGTKVENMGIS